MIRSKNTRIGLSVMHLASTLLLASGCKQRVAGEPSDFRALQNGVSTVCENLSTYRVDAPIDEVAVRRELDPIDYREDFESFQDVINKAHSIKSREPMAEGLDALEIASILAYTNTAYAEINKALWERRCDDFRTTTRILASAVNKTPAVKGAVYRGGRISDQEMQNNVYREGNVVEAPAFLSFSLDESTAKRFVRNAFFEIDPGVAGYTRIFSAWANENEVTFVPGATFKVDSVREVSSPDVAEGSWFHVKMTQTFEPVQEQVFDYIPATIRPGLIDEMGERSGVALYHFLSSFVREQSFAGQVPSTQSPCQVQVSVVSDGAIEFALTHSNFSGSGSVRLTRDGFITTGRTNYRIKNVRTHFQSRIPQDPMLVYHLSSAEGAVASDRVTLSLGFKGPERSLEHFTFTSPEVPYSPGCSF